MKLEAGKLDFTPSSSRVILYEQQRYMVEYLRCLEVRAEFEGIEL